MNKQEDILLAKCMTYAKNYLIKMGESPKLIFHIANERKANPIQAGILKAKGVTSGIPDVLFLWNGTTHYLEFKSTKGKLSPEQVKVSEAWEKHKKRIVDIRTFEHFEIWFLNIINNG